MKTIPIRIFTACCALSAALSLPSCKSTKSDGVVNYLPDGSALPKEEYPFDEKGNYREDWVSGTSSSSTASTSVASTKPNTYVVDTAPPPPLKDYDDTPAKPKPKPKPTASKPVVSKPKPAAKPVASKPKPKPKPAKKPTPRPVVKKAPPKPTLYKIQKGDTLYGLARKTGRSVADIKRYNNMSKDVLRDGWVIKIPPKK